MCKSDLHILYSFTNEKDYYFIFLFLFFCFASGQFFSPFPVRAFVKFGLNRRGFN